MLKAGGDGKEAVEMAVKDRPDVVVMDIAMPRMNGVEAPAASRRDSRAVRVVALSMHDEADMAGAISEAGAAVCPQRRLLGGPDTGHPRPPVSIGSQAGDC